MSAVTPELENNRKAWAWCVVMGVSALIPWTPVFLKYIATFLCGIWLGRAMTLVPKQP
jgi:hypothetical protein